ETAGDRLRPGFGQNPPCATVGAGGTRGVLPDSNLIVADVRAAGDRPAVAGGAGALGAPLRGARRQAPGRAGGGVRRTRQAHSHAPIDADLAPEFRNATKVPTRTPPVCPAAFEPNAHPN